MRPVVIDDVVMARLPDPQSAPLVAKRRGLQSSVTDGSARACPQTASRLARKLRGFLVGRRPVASTLLAVPATERAPQARGMHTTAHHLPTRVAICRLMAAETRTVRRAA